MSLSLRAQSSPCPESSQFLVPNLCPRGSRAVTGDCNVPDLGPAWGLLHRQLPLLPACMEQTLPCTPEHLAGLAPGGQAVTGASINSAVITRQPRTCSSLQFWWSSRHCVDLQIWEQPGAWAGSQRPLLSHPPYPQRERTLGSH